jgi:hypothetical protein
LITSEISPAVENWLNKPFEFANLYAGVPVESILAEGDRFILGDRYEGNFAFYMSNRLNKIGEGDTTNIDDKFFLICCKIIKDSIVFLYLKNTVYYV